jgi:hypothetical protein
MEPAEAGVKEPPDLFGVPAAIVGREEHEVRRGRSFRLADEESFDEFEHERSAALGGADDKDAGTLGEGVGGPAGTGHHLFVDRGGDGRLLGDAQFGEQIR